MAVARQVASELGAEALQGPETAYLLGATSPDIRVLTRQDRASTHYFDLGEHGHQDSVATFLQARPELAAPEKLNAATQAFVAGYISHLAMDEQYITAVYRPYFGDAGRLGGRMRANVMDRLLQYEMERSCCGDPELRGQLCEALASTLEGSEVGFIDGETLERWRQVTSDVARRTMDWDRARAMIANHLRISGLDQGMELNDFLDSLPGLLDETVVHITSPEVEGLVGRSAEAARRAIAGYLGCG